MMIYLGADHAGFAAKEQLKQLLLRLGHQIEDLGAPTLDLADDYPAYAFAVAERVAADSASLGILVCGSGQGVCIAANKVTGIRAVSSWNPEHAASTRAHDHANVLCLAARHLTIEDIESITERWLATPVSDDARHVRRIEQIRTYEA